MTPDKILDAVQASSVPMNKRDIAKTLRIKGSGPRALLKDHLRELTKSGALSKMKGGLYGLPDGLPPVAMLDIVNITADGGVFGAVQNNTADPAPTILVKPSAKHPAPAKGASVIARLKRVGTDQYEAKIIKSESAKDADNRIVGIIETRGSRAVLKPANKKDKHDFDIHEQDLNGAKDGDLVVAAIKDKDRLKRQNARVLDIIAHETDIRAISMLSMHEAGLDETFPDDVLKASEGLKVPALGKREDLRNVPLITIDGADARDFDDAVFAEPMDDDGFHLIVAIADVAYYVRPGSPLDIEAQRRGNSTYFPDRVVPMLPEALSNDLCSLRPHEDRATMVMHMWIDANGALKRYKCTRALIKSHARMTYEQVQALYDDGKAEDHVKHLYSAYRILDRARQKRGALDLDLPERQIIINDAGEMTGVQTKTRLDSHKLIEEFMVLANVAAASALEDKRDPKRYPCVYRIHDVPSLDKLESAREFLEGFHLSLPKTGVAKPAQINHVLQKAETLDYSHLISQVILRAQSQAVYSPENIGHFGLALDRYAHFTSPIRRYADLLVHRSLISAHGLGEGGLSDEERVRIHEISEHISKTERVSMEAERNAVDRFTAAFLSDKIGAEFRGKINGVTTFGLFVTLDETGADGIVPMRSLSNDFYIHNVKERALIGKRTGKVFRLGARVTVRLKEANGLTGSTVFEMSGDSVNGADIPGMELDTKKPSHHKKSTRRSQSYKKQSSKGNYKGKSKGKKNVN